MVRYMKNVRIIAAIMTAVCCAVLCSSCKQPEQKIEINAPTISSTFDEVPEFNKDAVEDSPNVNGKRFNLTLYDFTVRYNQLKQGMGETDLMTVSNWKTNGMPDKDGNGVGIQYYYYDDNEINITATVETESQKLVNVGVGTTVSKFMEQDGDDHNSERVLKKAALVAQAACQSKNNCIDVLQNIFYRTCSRTSSTALPPRATTRSGSTAMCSRSAPRRTEATAETASCSSACSLFPTRSETSGR